MASEVRHGDCLEVVRGLAAESVDLVYIDPPFFTQKTHSLVTRDRTTKFEFSDEWKSRAEYIAFLSVRLKEFRRVLKATGSLFFHCDTNASHHIRCLLDEVFGEAMFRSEIIWHYRRWSNSQCTPLPSHQTLFFYSKAGDYQYHQLFDDYSPATNVEQILQRRRRDEHGKSVYDRDESGHVVLDGHKPGVPIADVWDIPLLNPKAKERVGYPTQKPILLLERIIALVTSPGDLVLDPFSGSGTTLVAAELLGRNSLGSDISAEAVELARQRLAQPVRTASELLRKGRFDEIFFVDLPTRRERLDIFRLHVGRRLKHPDVVGTLKVTDEALGKLAEMTEGFIGAEIEQLEHGFSQCQAQPAGDVAASCVGACARTSYHGETSPLAYSCQSGSGQGTCRTGCQ